MRGRHPARVRRALILRYPAVERDARVTKEIRWLEAAGYRVDVLSRGPQHPDATGDAIAVGIPSLWRRLLGYLLLPSPSRFRMMIERRVPIAALAGRRYDLIIANGHEFAPWVVQHACDLTDGPVVLDLHELYSGTAVNRMDRLLHARYDRWLLRSAASEVFTARLTVAEGIADVYRDEHGMPRPAVIRNVGFHCELDPSPVDPERISLVHHGYAVLERGIDVMLDAAVLLEARFRLVLMVLGDERTLARLRRHPAVVSGRAELRDPVDVGDVAVALNDYDLELAFFPPRYRNLQHALPNKFFEAIQGRLGVVIGESREMVPYVRRLGIGIVVAGWTAADLAGAINRLDAEEVAGFKRAAAAAADDLSDRAEGIRFLEALGTS